MAEGAGGCLLQAGACRVTPHSAGAPRRGQTVGAEEVPGILDSVLNASAPWEFITLSMVPECGDGYLLSASENKGGWGPHLL